MISSRCQEQREAAATVTPLIGRGDQLLHRQRTVAKVGHIQEKGGGLPSHQLSRNEMAYGITTLRNIFTGPWFLQGGRRMCGSTTKSAGSTSAY